MKHTIDTLHHAVSGAYPKPYSFDASKNLDEQRKAIEKKYRELLKMPEKTSKIVPIIEWENNEDERFNEIRFNMETEPNFFVPCHIFFPKDMKKDEKLPCIICLQGHSTGMHISFGRPKYDGDEGDIKSGDRDFAIQALKRRYIAVCMEQRGMGELSSKVVGRCCHQYTMQAFMTGRVPQGERIHDISCLCDVLEHFENVDMDRIGIMGNSGGGTSSYHAMALEPRIKVCMPSCSFNMYEDSILAMIHCPCNYVPDIAVHFEMPDLAMLIAPRPLVIVNGVEDGIFPIEAAKRGFDIVKNIYTAAGAPDNCKHIIGNAGHRFYAADAWPVFDKFI